MQPSAKPAAPLANQTFSPARFGRLLARHTAERGAGYLLSAAVLAGAMLLIMGYVTYLQHSPPPLSVQQLFFVLFLLGAGSLFSSGVFTEYGHKTRGMAALTLPASQLEKFLLAWLWSLPVFLVVFVAIFYAVDASVLAVAAQPGQTAEMLPWRSLFDLHKGGPIFLLYAMLNGAWLWGSIYFTKGQFVKMGFGLLLLGGLGAVLNFQVIKALLGPGLALAPTVPFADLGLQQGEEFFRLALPESQTAWLSLLPLVLAGLLWVASYYRLREKQV